MSTNSDSSSGFLSHSEPTASPRNSPWEPAQAGPALPSCSNLTSYPPCAHCALASRLLSPQICQTSSRLKVLSVWNILPRILKTYSLTFSSFLLRCPLIGEIFLIMPSVAFLPHCICMSSVYQHLTKDVFVSCLFFMRRETSCCSHCISNVFDQCPAQRKA